MTTRTGIGAVVLVAMACLLAATAQAQGARGRGRGPGGAGMGPGPRGLGGPDGPPGGLMAELMIDHLDLTPEQLEAIGAERGLWAERGEELRREMWERRKAVREASQARPLDEEAVRAAALGAAEIEVELAVHRARALQAVYGLLTEEQLTELDTLRERMAERRERMRDRFRERRFPGAD
ncbi:MAG: Spy/CpxP family protein refolding chaperone [Thermoanaerobaculia bacterium]|nr:Spy/CpxP family protein refolding chaperone [Thermoanaerobaculia bacterium]